MRLVESLLKHMNIKSVYYYNANFNEAGRVDDKFVPQWTKFVAGKNECPLIANNALLGDPILGVVKRLFINFTLFDDADDNMLTLIYKEDEVSKKGLMYVFLFNENVEKQKPDTYFINTQDRWLTTTGSEKGETLRPIQ